MMKSYRKVDLLIQDEWLIRRLALQKSYNPLEFVEAATPMAPPSSAPNMTPANDMSV